MTDYKMILEGPAPSNACKHEKFKVVRITGPNGPVDLKVCVQCAKILP